MWELFPLWINEAIGSGRDLIVAMDWTEFDGDDQSTLVLSLVTWRESATTSRTPVSRR